jgi:hypothetical protein
MGESSGVYRVSVGKPEVKRPLGRPMRRWEDNNKMDIQEIVWGLGLDCSGSEWGGATGCCECGNEPSGSIK